MCFSVLRKITKDATIAGLFNDTKINGSIDCKHFFIYRGKCFWQHSHLIICGFERSNFLIHYFAHLFSQSRLFFHQVDQGLSGSIVGKLAIDLCLDKHLRNCIWRLHPTHSIYVPYFLCFDKPSKCFSPFFCRRAKQKHICNA